MTKPNHSKPTIWRKKPKQSRSIKTASTILDAAEKSFLERGFHNTKSEDIASYAGVGVSSLYDFFPNKTAIALALLERSTFAIIDDSRKIFKEQSYGSQSFKESLPLVINGIFQNYKRHKNVLIDLVAEVPELRATDIYSIDRLIHRASLIYMRMFMDEFIVDDLEQAHAFVHLLFSASLKEFLTQPPEELSEQAFLDQLYRTLLLFLTGQVVN